MSEALALLELSSIARGYQVADAVVKRAPVALRDCRPVSPGKFLVLFDGDVASVDESFRRGVEIAGDRLVDKLFLPQAHAQLFPAVRGQASARGGEGVESVESYAVVETLSVASTLLAADAAAKAAAVRVIEMQLGRGIGGKAFFALSGALPEIEAAVDAAVTVTDRALLLGTEIIAAPHEDFLARLP